MDDPNSLIICKSCYNEFKGIIKCYTHIKTKKHRTVLLCDFCYKDINREGYILENEIIERFAQLIHFIRNNRIEDSHIDNNEITPEFNKYIISRLTDILRRMK